MSFGKGGIGGLIGGLLGSVLAPEIGIPLLAATAGGSFLGSTAEGLASGEPFGKAAIGGLESGAISGATTGVGELLSGVPLSSTASPFGNLFGGGGGGAAGGIGAVPAGEAAALTGGVTGETAAAGAPTLLASNAAPASGASLGGGNIGDIAGNVGSAAPADLSQTLGVAGPGSSGEAPAFMGMTSIDNPSTAGSLNAQELSQLTSPGAPTATGTSLVTSSGGGSPDFIGTTPFGSAPTTGDFGTGTAGGTDGGAGIGNSIMNYLKNNPGLLLGGGLLGTELLMNKGTNVPGAQPLQQNAASLNAAGTSALDALRTGAVPPGAQSLLDQTRNSQRAQVKSHFGNIGLSGSTMESTALAQVDQNVEANKWNIINDLTRTGLTEVGAANNIYTTLMNQEIANDKATSDALARFAAALAGSGGRQSTAT